MQEKLCACLSPSGGRGWGRGREHQKQVNLPGEDHGKNPRLRHAAPLRRPEKKCIAVHAACGPKDLNLPEDIRRDLIERFAGPGKRPTKDLDTKSADALLNYLLQLGAKCRSHADGPIRVSPEKAGLLAKIGALLAEQKKPWQYAHAVAQNNFGKDRVEWLPVGQLRGLIAQLVKTGAAMAARKG